MSYFRRALKLQNLLSSKSIFLLGPRSVGKTTLIENELQGVVVYDLLDAEIFRKLVARPKILAEENPDKSIIIAIDEIQKLPTLLDEVHRLIVKENRRFLLTGSSARKLKRSGTNLLAGRAWRADLLPLTYREITNFNLINYLNRGGLPEIYLSINPTEELRAYTSLYLREEIYSESLTRNLQAFTTFLDVMAISNGEEINFQSLASDCGINVSTLKNYIQILQDTLLGFSLSGFTKTKKRKSVARIKHYFFDIGVVNSICNRGEIREKSELFGKSFEHFIILEVRAHLLYQRIPLEMSYWRSTSQFEVDLVVGNFLAIEIKATDFVQDRQLKGIRALKEEGIFKHYLIISTDSKRRMTDDGIEILPWEYFLQVRIHELLSTP